MILWLTQHTSPRLLITAPGGWGWGLEKGAPEAGARPAAVPAHRPHFWRGLAGG